ncbi:hypothetical protein EPUS_04070 [Endocarpon pusillum Z07020]|uniref:Uncharacterized protein n=1 Tax=Endocarpon pusillum (strain Z07020 / HMAS-L-300199) TaxID=1263415 RepID=U1G7P0_ENDPU|nr:uncharacterized protein EPUS_04070 [Endocarpon pusillum Z07020]ERF73447.1 hypothetical protein EPUS_04070 [Endocarpon pusillum Z07020]
MVDSKGKPDENGRDLMWVRFGTVSNCGMKVKRDKVYWTKWLLVLEETVIRLCPLLERVCLGV